MVLVSYAQNFEDVILWRALRHVQKGVYVDVGAWDPIEHSVTNLFYKAGWRGINIEPHPHYFALLREMRPEDRNLDLAIGVEARRATLYANIGGGMSSLLPEYAEIALQRGVKSQPIDIEVRPLSSVLDECRVETIHFLKIDAEGCDADVIASLDMSRHRPWIILVEVNDPALVKDAAADWEGMLRSSGYDFVYADGLNKFFLAQERSDLAGHFLLPPNLFDGFISRRQDELERELIELRAERDKLRAENEELVRKSGF